MDTAARLLVTQPVGDVTAIPAKNHHLFSCTDVWLWLNVTDMMSVGRPDESHLEAAMQRSITGAVETFMNSLSWFCFLSAVI